MGVIRLGFSSAVMFGWRSWLLVVVRMPNRMVFLFTSKALTEYNRGSTDIRRTCSEIVANVFRMVFAHTHKHRDGPTEIIIKRIRAVSLFRLNTIFFFTLLCVLLRLLYMFNAFGALIFYIRSAITHTYSESEPRSKRVRKWPARLGLVEYSKIIYSKCFDFYATFKGKCWAKEDLGAGS